MGGSTPFSHNQYETIARNSVEDGNKFNRSHEKLVLKEQTRGSSSSLWFPNGYEQAHGWRLGSRSGEPLQAREEDNLRLVRRSSTSDALSPPGVKSSRRFVPNKVLLELRPDLKTNHRSGRSRGNTLSSAPLNSDGRPLMSAPSLCRRHSDKSTLPSSYGRCYDMDGNGEMTSIASMSDPLLIALARKDQPELPIMSPTGDSSILMSLSERRLSSSGNTTCAPPKKPAPRPTKTVLQLCDRSARPSSLTLRDRSACPELAAAAPPSTAAAGQQQERPAYARRFMTNRPSNCVLPSLPVLTRPPDDSVTPSFALDQELEEPHQLGLRPPSPEPRSLLLNAPKKRRFPTLDSSSNAFDFSCLSRMLRPYDPSGHQTAKRPVCRALRFGD